MGWREDKIGRLRAKARSTKFPHERDAFNRKADQLEAGAARMAGMVGSTHGHIQAYERGAVIFDQIGDRESAAWCRNYAATTRAMWNL